MLKSGMKLKLDYLSEEILGYFAAINTKRVFREILEDAAFFLASAHHPLLMFCRSNKLLASSQVHF